MSERKLIFAGIIIFILAIISLISNRNVTDYGYEDIYDWTEVEPYISASPKKPVEKGN